MKKTILILVLTLLCNLSFADNKYSHQDFTGKSFKHLPASEFNNLEIVGSCFYQPNLTNVPTMFDIFPDGVVGIKFIACNLDNVLVPIGNELSGSLNCNRTIIFENGVDTEVNE